MCSISKILDENDSLDPRIINAWIKKEKKASAQDVPPDVIEYLSRVKTVPLRVAELLPHEGLPVEKFIHISLPTVEGAIVYAKASTWFSQEHDNCRDLSILLLQPIPPKSFVVELLENVDQAVLDGCQSMVNPKYPAQRFPLFAPTFLQHIHVTLEAQSEWRHSLKWIGEQTEEGIGNKISTTLQILQVLPWRVQLDLTFTSTHSTTLTLSRLLSDHWMTSSLIDLMIGQLSDRLARDSDLDSCVVLEPLRFMEYLQHPEKHETRLRHTSFTLKRKDKILCVSHWAKKRHWVAFKIMMKDGTITYEDNPRPKDLLAHLTKWFGVEFSKKFQAPNPGNLLEHGIQNDFYNCGLVAVNAIEHDLWNDGLWTSEKKVHYRVRWFNTLAEVSLGQVLYPMGISSLLNPVARSGGMNISDLLNPETTVDLPLNSGTSSRMEISSLIYPSLKINPTISSKHPRSPESGSFNESSLLQKLTLPNMDSNEESSDFALTDVEGDISDADSVATAQTVDEFYMSFKGPGTSKSAAWARARNQDFVSLENKDYVSSNAKHRARMRKMLIRAKHLDLHAEIITAKSIRHSKCGKKHKLDAPFKISNFWKHVLRHCNGRGNDPGAGTHSISNWFKPVTARSSSGSAESSPAVVHQQKFPKSARIACPGLSHDDHPGIVKVLDRTGALGGGAPSITVLSRRLYGCAYRNLSIGRKRNVKILQCQEWRWEYHHDLGRVFSTSCACTLDPKDSSGPCFQCFTVLHLKHFRTAIAIPKPDLKNYKFLPKEYRNETISIIFARSLGLEALVQADPSKTPALKYTLGVLEGKFLDGKPNEFFGNLLKVMNMIQSKRECGVGMEGFKWSPLITQIAQTVSIISPAAYNALKTFIPLPEVRTLQRQRAALSKFPINIKPRTFELAKAHLDDMHYNGPVALSCDDTKLQPAFRPFHNEDRGGWCILGSTGEPMLIADPEEYQKAVSERKVEKATKLRLWCMTVCCPGVPSYILAAKAIPNSSTVDELFQYSDRIIRGLLEKGVLVCSYSCDGTVVERNVQHRLESSAESTHTHTIFDPRSGHSSIVITIPVIAGQPIALIQDDLHLLKTIRNNAYSGARLLTFPNCVVTFTMIQEIAHENGPLYNRDASSKTDRQDDNGAIRFASPSTVEWLCSEEHYSEEKIGLIAYTFVFGDMVDAFQSRTIPLRECPRMILRAYFFLDIWERYLDIAGYQKSKHFLSHLGTSICEHVFGISRSYDPDFTMYSWHTLMPKIKLMLRNAILSGEQGKNGRARASGYNHSYLDRHGIDIAALSVFPSDVEINEASKMAYEDAVSLFSLLGIAPEELEGSSSLPSISSWFAPCPQDSTTSHAFEDDEPDADESDEPNVDNAVGKPALQSFVDATESITPSTSNEHQRLMGYRYAAVALEINRDMAMCVTPIFRSFLPTNISLVMLYLRRTGLQS
ncbi:hypothetical protein GGU10DRAFT_279690 [Lentinula aff. detonsa]|uniref:Ubiquitin-like protease family profile domain-containing protein n=1 Tax=Lentinula aff. detonsa TaxID=2804958 RepID=A0AA38K7L7_9AGAR|nr:hypothetical protein GGU10DRAFT_279690 [Lentinula aff. detonsa]